MACIGVFQAYYTTHQLRDYPANTIGWIPSAETFLLFLGVPVFGGLFDRLGPTVILVVGTVLHVGGLLGLASCEAYGQIFAAQSIVRALGTGATAPPPSAPGSAPGGVSPSASSAPGAPWTP